MLMQVSPRYLCKSLRSRLLSRARRERTLCLHPVFPLAETRRSAGCHGKSNQGMGNTQLPPSCSAQRCVPAALSMSHHAADGCSYIYNVFFFPEEVPRHNSFCEKLQGQFTRDACHITRRMAQNHALAAALVMRWSISSM